MERLGPYELLGELGRGGMGVVHRARHAETGAEVALKVITAGGGGDTPDAGLSPESIARFQREARIAQELDHPGIVRCLDAGEDGGTAWFAMELVEGEPLAAQISQREFTWQEAVTIVRDVAGALAVAHAKGVLHRDLKPSNILVGRKLTRPVPEAGGEHPASAVHGAGQSKTPSVFLTDFGLAKDSRTESKYTRSGQTLGTPAYMSPEQARGELAQLTPASDVWALGCVCYELLANRPAFEGDTPAAVVGAVLTTTPSAPAGLPRPVTELLFAALDRDPARRPSDAAAFAAECERVLRGERPVQRPARRLPVPAIAGVVAVAGAAALWLVWPRADRPEPADPAAVAAAAAEAGARAAWELRRTDVEAATEQLERACNRLGEGTGWHVRLGVLRWAREGAEAAIAQWDRVPAGAPEAGAARWLSGLASVAATSEYQNAALEARTRRDWQAAAEAGGATARWAEAGLAMLDERWGRARELLGEPQAWDAALLRGYVETRLGSGNRDAAAGVRAYTTALTRGIPMAWVYVNRGAMYNDLEDAGAALADYGAALELEPEHRVALLNRALHLSRAGRRTESLAEFDRLIGLHPDYLDGYRRRAGVRLAAGRHREAIRDYSRVIQLLPGDVSALVNRGIARMGVQDRSGALADYNRALQSDPASTAALLNRAILHYHGRDRGAAERDLRAALEADPRFWKASSWLGTVLQERGDHAGAVAAFDAALAEHGANPIALVSRGRSKDLLGDTSGALADYGTALEIDEGHSDAYAFRAMTHQKLGDLDAALEDYSRALELEPKRPPALLNRGLIHRAQGRTGAALRDLNAALELQPDFLPARVSRAAILMGRQELAKATADLEFVLARAPKGSQVRAVAERNLAKIHRAQGR